MRVGIVLVLGAVACGGVENGEQAGSYDTMKAASERVKCSTLDLGSAWVNGALPEEADSVALLAPQAIRNLAEAIFFGRYVDLDCDGVSDYIAHIRGADAGPWPNALGMVAAIRNDQGERPWTVLLFAPSDVNGREIPIFAADLQGLGKRDVITLQSDEGGYIPRALVWKDAKMEVRNFPSAQSIRMEELWDKTCLQEITPKSVGGPNISVVRETIPLTAAQGHGAECNLPKDTIAIGALIQRK